VNDAVNKVRLLSSVIAFTVLAAALFFAVGVYRRYDDIWFVLTAIAMLIAATVSSICFRHGLAFKLVAFVLWILLILAGIQYLQFLRLPLA
jgi:hypothetical protein